VIKNYFVLHYLRFAFLSIALSIVSR
jgi:hypothetical protein